MSEQPPWNAGEWPTPEEYTDWFISLPRDKQLKSAKNTIDTAILGWRCILEDHIGRLGWCEENHMNKNETS
jgi:hypothetical protein